MSEQRAGGGHQSRLTLEVTARSAREEDEMDGVHIMLMETGLRFM